MADVNDTESGKLSCVSGVLNALKDDVVLEKEADVKENLDEAGINDTPIENAPVEDIEIASTSTETVCIQKKCDNGSVESNHKEKDSNVCYADTEASVVDSKNISVEQLDATINKEKTEVSATPDASNVHYEGDIAIYTDPSSGHQYTWNAEKQEWEVRSSMIYGFEDDTHTYTDVDGVKYFWDKDKNAWFPKINDEFMANYQLNYGFIDNTQPAKEVKAVEKVEVPEKKGEKRKPSEPTWFDLDRQNNTKVYVSNLPLDITEEEFTDLMQKYGLIMREPVTGKLKIKFYTEPNSTDLKGDALCSYIRVESVDLALKLLDGSVYRGHTIKVEHAKFQMKGEYDPKLKPKSKKRKEKQKLKKMQEKLFDWKPEKKIGERSKNERIVIVKNLFEPAVFDENVSLILEFQQDLREECSKCGDVRKVMIYDRHPEGVAQINMKTPEEADACVLLLNNRWFGKRLITAEIWDGKVKYKIAETDAQISQRLEKWDEFLEDTSKEVKCEKK